MATPAQSLPQMPEQQGAGLSDLMGGEAEARSNPSDKQQQSRAFVGQIKELHTFIEDLARQWPFFAETARNMQDMAKEGMAKGLSSLQGAGESGNVPRMA
jgi:hypothetical protein